MDLVDHEDDVAKALDLVNKALHPAFKLAAELGASHKGGQVQEIDFLFPQLKRHLACHDPPGQALGNGGLAHAGLADEAGVILLAAI